MLVLGGDVGGTTTRLQLAELAGNNLHSLATAEYTSAAFPDLHTLVQAYLSGQGILSRQLDAACFAVAGPVCNGEVQLTNLPWYLTQSDLQQHLAIPYVRLINDFSAIGYALSLLTETDTITLQQGRHEERGVRAVIGAGTGLGIGIVVTHAAELDVLPSEGGHIDFAPVNEWQIGLWRWLQTRQGRVSNEDLLSGRGLISLYQYVCHQSALRASLLEHGTADDTAAVISRHALAGDDPLAVEAVQHFVSIYGAVAGNLALLLQPRAGLCLAGGIAAKLGHLMQAGAFMQSFLDKPPMREVLDQIPVKIITDPHVGLKGAVAAASRLCNTAN